MKCAPRAPLLLSCKMSATNIFLLLIFSVIIKAEQLSFLNVHEQQDDTVDRMWVSVREMLDSGTADLLNRFPGTGQASRALESEIDVPWYSSALREEDTSAREVLEVTSVRKDENFRYGAGVFKWMSLGVGSTTFIVGLRPKGVTLLTASFIAPDVGSGQTYSLSEIKFETQGTPLAATIYKHWNFQTKSMEAILVIALDSPRGDLYWYRLGSNGLELKKSWSVFKVVFDLKVFQVGEQYKLLLITQCDNVSKSPCKANADIFVFSLSSFEHVKLYETFSLDGVPASIELGSVGDEQYLAMALPDVGVVKLFRYQKPTGIDFQLLENTTSGSFIFWKEIRSPLVNHAIFFHVSYKMYLAIGGSKPAIMRFVNPTHIEGCPNALQDLGNVFAWMVLPVQTYRDEIVLLAEVAVGVSRRTVLSLTWGGEGVFRLQPHPPCLGETEYGSCLLEEGSQTGLDGAVALQLGDASVVTILMPRSVKPSVLFRMYTQLKPILNPLLREYSFLNQAQLLLQMEFRKQDSEISETERMLESTLKTEGSNIITANWVIEEVYTPEHETSDPDVNGSGISFDDLLTSLKKLIVETKSVMGSAAGAAVFDGETLHLSGSHTLLGGVEISNVSVFAVLSVHQLNGEVVSSLLKDVVRTDQLDKIGGEKTLTEVESLDIDFASVNEISKDDLIFDVPNKPIVIDGKVTLSELLHVAGNVDLPSLGTVNLIDLSEEVFQTGKAFKGAPHIQHVTIKGDLIVDIVNTIEMHPYSLRTIVMGGDWLSENGTQYDNLEISGSLVVERVNGYLWNDLVKRIVWKDVPNHIDGLSVIDGAFHTANLTVWQLNNLAFPDDYVLRSSSTQYVIGKKELNGLLLVGDVAIENYVDGVPLKSLITLSTHQELDGALKLDEADIHDDVKVDWGINGISLDQIHTKSALIGQGRPVLSNVDFSELEVQGHVVVSNTADGLSLKDFLEDVVVVPQNQAEKVEVKCRKIFAAGLTVKNSGMFIPSGIISELNLANFARVDVPQNFIGVTAVEEAMFRDLHLSGLWDSVNIVELNADTMRRTGNQESSAWLSFSSPSELWASQLVILGHLNTMLPRSAVEKANGNLCDAPLSPGIECVINSPVLANRINVLGKLFVDGQICGWNLLDFDIRRLSRSRPQTVDGVVSFGNMHIKNHLQINFINEFPIEVVRSNYSPQTIFLLKPALQAGNFAVDDLMVEGEIETLHGVNKLNISYISEMAVKLVGENLFTNHLIFDSILTADKLEVYGPLNEHKLAFLMHDTVSRQDLSRVVISGIKVFNAGFNVEGTIFTPQLTGLNPTKIITKSSALNLQGTLRIEGNVHAGNVDVNGLLNKLPVSYFQNRYKLLEAGHHLLQGPTHFSAGVAAEELFIMGRINNILFGELLNSVVMKTESTRITGNKMFINKVTFKNVSVDGLVKGVKLLEFAHDVILFNDEDEVVVDGSITFTEKVTAGSGVAVSENLYAMELDGCLVKEWFDNAVYLNEVTSVGGAKEFSNISSHSDLSLSVLNAIDLSKIISLNQPQDIPAGMSIPVAGVQNNLEVHGLVNGIHLPSELENTLMNKGNQYVTGQKTFLSGLTVDANLVSNGLISGKNLSNSVTLDSVQTVKGPLKFQSVMIEGNLHVDGQISNVNVQSWKERAFLSKSLHPQLVSGQWSVLGHTRFMDEVGGGGLLDEENVNSLALEVQRAQKTASEIQREIMADWMHLCQDTNALLEMARAQPFLFQQVEVVQALSSPLTSSMHAFEAGQEQFLVVSFAHSCSGAVYRWDSQLTSWTLVDVAIQNIGGVEKWTSLRNANSTYLISSSNNENCPYRGGNVWRLGPGLHLRNIHSMDSWHDALVDQVQGRLYTLSLSGVSAWQIQDGSVIPLNTWAYGNADKARFLPGNIGLGLSVSDGQFTTVISQTPDQTAYERLGQRSVNASLPARDQGSIAVMEVSNGRRLVAVSHTESDVITVFEDIPSGRVLGIVRAHRAHSLSVLELTAPGRQGQTLLAFIEDERLLRVVEYKGVEGFVDVTEAKLAVSVKEMIPVRLEARGLVNQRHFLLLRSDYKVLLLELEMAGDPLDESSLNCNL